MSDLIDRQPVAKDINVPCTDTISRQAAIDAHCELCPDRGSCSDICPDVEVFKLLPSVQSDMSGYSDRLWKLAYERGKRDAQQEWIPVTERLPEVSERVLCQCRADNFEVLKLATDRSWIKDSTHIYMSGFVVAWMPLPEPYKGEK